MLAFTIIPQTTLLDMVWGDLDLVVDNLCVANLPMISALMKLLILRFNSKVRSTMFINKKILITIALLVSVVLARSKENRNFEKEHSKDVSTSQKENRKFYGSMLAEITKELMERSTTSSQVLNLNLSNLLLLLVLKAVVFGAGYMGNHGHKGREINEVESVVSEGEIALALGYLIGDTCLYRAACEVPQTAKEYLAAAEMIVQTMKLIPQSILQDQQYEKTIEEFRKAIEYGSASQCPPQYSCKKENISKILRTE
ncbi:uncharacterized protein LOC107267203 isoform X2 [Cephus cinctus]|uniref:Uncharacterized protein LOC107267203 isoform X2 n=1 Tax=Cephus cinctus TaxID=211228 RepID=A0AAJ7BUK2_CEPCN|nr:uncharacterized protein LOC107267203 isoform X2 [Cephus cinctus]